MDLQDFASGDTDYISKLNQNNTELENAIAGLETQMGAVGGGSALNVGLFLDAIFDGVDALIGPLSYTPTKVATTLSIGPGSMYLADSQVVVTSLNTVPLSFLGQTSGTKYIIVDVSGSPRISDDNGPGAIYSVVWTGSAFGNLVYLTAISFDALEATAARKSTVMKVGSETEHVYPNLDARLEASETLSKQAAADADSAVAMAYELAASISAPIRKVGITVDGAGGIKGAIQIDFDGTIIGWSCIADAVGTLQVEVDRKASTAPPSPPAIPNTTTDKISASSPIALASAQSAARAEAGVSTWNTVVHKWDVLQFTTVAVSGITKATLYLRIFELLPSPPAISPHEFDFTSPEFDVPEEAR